MEKPTQERAPKRSAPPRSQESANHLQGPLGDDCAVRNLSDRGACLIVESSIGIPDSFDLMLDHASVFKCLVTWRKATQIGVTFA